MGESRFKPEAPLIGEDWRASVRCSNYNLARQSSREESRNRDNAKNAISVDDLGCSNSLPRSRTALSIKLTWLRRLPSKESILTEFSRHENRFLLHSCSRTTFRSLSSLSSQKRNSETLDFISNERKEEDRNTCFLASLAYNSRM